MKKIISILVTLTMLLTLCASFTFSVSAAGNNPYISVPKTEADIILDGEKGTEYDKAVKIPITRLIYGNKPTDGDAYIMWGADQKLYFYVDVFDKDLSNSKDVIDSFDVDPANTDCVELYVYWGNGEQVVMYRITYDGVLYCQQNAHAGGGLLINEKGEASDNFEAAVKQTDTGYGAEFKLDTYLANLCEGALISFKVVISSTDDAATYSSATSNFGCALSQTRYHDLASTAPTAYLNMLLVGPDGADATYRKFPTISVDDIDSKRFNAEKTEQALEIREATIISPTEVVVKFSKPCTLQWFSNAPVFMGVCSSANVNPVANPDIDAGDSWQIGVKLDTAVTNDGGTTWKLQLFRKIYEKGNGQFADGVFRASETQGNDLSYYMSDNSFVGHVISMDGDDYLHANRANKDDHWDVAYVEYTVNTNYVWDSTNETSLPATTIDLASKMTDEATQTFLFDNRLRDALEEDIQDPNSGNTGEQNGEGETDETDSTRDPNANGDEGNWLAENWWIIAVAAAAVVIVVVVVVIVASGSKKKK